MKMRSSITFLFLSIVTLQGLAQYRLMGSNHAEALGKRTVLIELFDDTSGAGKQANEYIENYFKANLNLGKEVLCKSRRDIIALLRTDLENYALIIHKFGKSEIESVKRYMNVYTEKRTTMNDFYGVEYKRHMATLNHYDLVLYIPSNDPHQNSAVTEISFVHYRLRPEDYVFAAMQFNRLNDAALQGLTPRQYYDPKRELMKLKTKTLLIDPENVTFKPENAKGYGFPYEFVNYSVIRNAVFSKEAGKVYTLMIWSTLLDSYDWVCVDAETGEIYSQVAHGGVNFTKFGDDAPPAKMKMLHFRYFDSLFANKANNRYK